MSSACIEGILAYILHIGDLKETATQTLEFPQFCLHVSKVTDCTVIPPSSAPSTFC